MSKKYIIFGASGAIGSALAEQLYNEKADCHLVGRDENEIKKLSVKFSYSYSICDVLKLNFTDKLLTDLASTEILGIAYCVGSINIKPFKNTETKDFVSSYVLNLVAATDIIRVFQDNLKRNNGSVVLFSTVAAKKGFVNHSIISSAKAGVEGLTVALAAELAPNIRVNCIAPGLIDTEMLSKNTSSDIVENMKSKISLRRVGSPEEVADIALFLSSNLSTYISGQVIRADGGM